MATSTPTTKKGFGCLILFALPFAAVGVGMGVWLLFGIIDHWKMQSWEETPARIVQAKLESHSGSKGGTTYQATAEYTYQYADGSTRATGLAFRAAATTSARFSRTCIAS